MLKVSECFVTGRSEWSNLGGLIGMILTLADAAASSKTSATEDALKKAQSKARRLGLLNDADKLRELEAEALVEVRNNRLRLFGPPNLRHTLATARRFVFRKGMPVEVNEVKASLQLSDETEDGSAPYYADENIKVWAMSIAPPGQSRPTTPRKRSIDEVYGRDSMNGVAPAQDGSLSPVSTVVNEMFNSTWRMDTLYETPLNEVKLPAAIYVRHPKTNKVVKYEGPLPGGDTPVPDPTLKVLVRKPWPGALIESLPKTAAARQSVSYIVRNHRQRGRFRPDLALQLKVEKGTKFSQLTSGITVLNADGETITPDMVLEPTKEGGGFAVVDLPDASYIQPLIDRPEWSNERLMTGVGAFIWICGKDVATDPKLHTFMQRFSDLHHLVSSPDYCPNEIMLDSVAASTARLSEVDPERWRIPIHSDQAQSAAQSLPFPGVRPAKRGQIVQLEPKFEFNIKAIPPNIDLAEIKKKLSQKVLDQAAAAQEATKNPSEQDLAWQNSLVDGEAEVITLGTGSALPSKYRNVSATLVRVPGWGSFLLDCGENTIGQLKRVFSAEELKEVLQDLRLIFISHMHADHHLGTASVIKAWYEEVHNSLPIPAVLADSDKTTAMSDQGKRLSIIAEPAMMHWLSEYASVEDYGYSRIAPLIISPAWPENGFSSQLIWFNSSSEGASISTNIHYDDPAAHASNIVPASALGLADVKAVLVRHCHGARAISITLPSGFKASYSGDCRPSRSFAKIGRGSTVCIHEATFDDELQGDAEAKNHSTTSEALSVAQAMTARACVLTHFSQRYQKLPVLERAALEDQDDDLEVLAEAEAEDADADNDDVEIGGPLEADMAPTMPDQNGTGAVEQGEKVDLPEKHAKKARTFSSGSSGPPVRFLLPYFPNCKLRLCRSRLLGCNVENRPNHCTDSLIHS